MKEKLEMLNGGKFFYVKVRNLDLHATGNKKSLKGFEKETTRRCLHFRKPSRGGVRQSWEGEATWEADEVGTSSSSKHEGGPESEQKGK